MNEMLVSAIMPTANRPDMARRAARMFLAQTYEPKELVIIDEGPVDLPGLPNNERIVYIRNRVSRNIGAKRNQACSLAAGEIIMHWDDDDHYAPERMAEQVKDLLANPGHDMVGFDSMRFVNEATGERWKFTGQMRDYAIGVSMTYWKSAWRERPFREMTKGEDGAFWDGRRCKTRDAGHLIVATIHGQNTCPRNTTTSAWERI